MLATLESTSMYTLSLQSFPILIVLALAYYLTITYFALGLNRYPGPFLAKFGKLWHRISVQRNCHQLDLVKLHRKYGDVVRIGPDTLSVSNPEWVSRIYGVSVGLRKSDMYDVFAPRINGKPRSALLSERDPSAHALLSKPMAREFAFSVISEYEPLVDKTLRQWTTSLEERFCGAKNPDVCDMADWVRFFAQEAIMDVTFSESLGFLDKGHDVEGFLASLDKNIDYSGVLTTMPWTCYLIRHNPIVGMFSKDSTMFPQWSVQRINARLKQRAEGKTGTLKDRKGQPLRDFLDRFLDASISSEPPGYNLPLVMSWCLVNIMAGGDTTTTGLSSIVYHLLKHPAKHARLVAELRSAGLTVPVSWQDCQKLPYLDGCVREGLRMHPPIGLGLERDAGGLVMPDGYILPQGSKVSMNAWVVCRQSSVYGAKVDEFIPERWLQQDDESKDAYTQRINRMKRVDVTFGSGARACCGKFVAYMETYKAIATLFHEFDVSLANSSGNWSTVNRWVTRVSDIKVHLKKVSLTQ